MNLFSPQPKDIVLRNYQESAVERLREGIRQGCRRQILVAPTGSGKTIMAMHLIAESQRKGARAWFIADRLALIDQTSDSFAAYGIDHGIIQADHWLTDMAKPVQIISAQTLERRKVQSLPDLIIVDEAHDQRKGVIAEIERASKAKVVGLTATPFSPGMADHWEGIVNSATTNQLLEMGNLAPLKIKACVAPDMTGAKIRLGEYAEDDSASRGIVIIGDVVQTWIEQTRRHFGGPAKTIVFSPSVKHGAELCRQFADAGYNFQQLSHLDRDNDLRREKIAEFRKPDSAINGLVSCAVLTKGFDVPDCLVGISCRPYRKSFSSHIQEMGRVMRVAPGKEYGLWLDHSSNVIRFADDTAWLFENGVDSLSDAARRDSEVREATEAVKKERFCGDCGMQMEAGAMVCQSCGWEKPARGEIRVIEGQVQDFQLSLMSNFQPRQGLRAECLKDPRAVWAAAVAYWLDRVHGDIDKATKCAYRNWKGIYPDAKLPSGLWDKGAQMATEAEWMFTPEWSLIDREVKRGWKQRRKAA